MEKCLVIVWNAVRKNVEHFQHISKGEEWKKYAENQKKRLSFRLGFYCNRLIRAGTHFYPKID